MSAVPRSKSVSRGARQHRAATKPANRPATGMEQLKAVSRSVKKMNISRAAKSDVAAVLEAFTLPKEAQPIRLGTSKYGGDPTGSCNPFEEQAISFNATTGSLANATNAMFCFRSLLRATVYSFMPTSAFNYSGQHNIPITPGHLTPFNPGALRATTPYLPHGPYLFAGRHGLADMYRGFWADEHTVVNIATEVSTLPPAGLAVNVRRSNGREWEDVIQGQLTTANSGQFTFPVTIAEAGYLAYEFGYVDPTRAQQVATVFSVTVAHSVSPGATTLCYGHKTLPDLENQLGAIDTARVTAVAIKCTNNSAAINRQGTIACVQFDKGTLWQDADEFHDFTVQRKATILPSDNGAYGFCKPQDDTDLEFSPEIVRRSNGASGEYLFELPALSDAAFDIVPSSPYIGIAFDVQKVAGAIPTGVTGYWTRAFGIEFVTNDQWRSLSRSTLNPEAVEIALHVLSETPQWYTNDFHLDDLWRNIKEVVSKVANGIVEYGPTVLKGATMLAPLLL